jgi:hypothetical protein
VPIEEGRVARSFRVGRFNACAVAVTAALLCAGEVAAGSHGASPDVVRYFGTPSGWSYRGSSANASASTMLGAAQTNGILLLFCERDRIGFHLSLSTTDRRSLQGVEDGLLTVYAVDAPDDPPLAQFQVRLFSEHELRTATLAQPEWNRPADLLEIIRSQFGGLRLVMTRNRLDGFNVSRTVELYLPEGTDGSGLPMETALAFLQRDCESGLKSHDTPGG